MVQNEQYRIDFNLILETAKKSVRRTSTFLGLGLNATNDPEFKKYELTDITLIQLMPDNLPEETVNHLKEEFNIWIIANGFRELIETFSLFLDQVHYACTIMALYKNKISEAQFKKKQQQFIKQGFPNKLNLLHEHYSVAPKNPNFLKSLNKTRNCLTHRQGIVASCDCNNNLLSTSWVGMKFYIEEPNGNQIIITEQIKEGIYLKDGGKMIATTIDRNIDFKIGTLINLTANDLAEICWFILNEAQYTINSAIQYAKDMNIEFSDEINGEN